MKSRVHHLHIILPILLPLSSFLIFGLPCGLGYEPDTRIWGGTLALAERGLAPHWSPDGERIVFTRDVGKRDNGVFEDGSLYIARADGSSVDRITGGSGKYHVDYSPEVSPDGSRLVYVTTRHLTKRRPDLGVTRNFEIETSDLDGSARRRLTNNVDADMAPTWSPDGMRIAFLKIDARVSVEHPVDGGVYTMEADGSETRRLLAFPTDTWDSGPKSANWGWAGGPKWSPDGNMLAFPLAADEIAEGDQQHLGRILKTAIYSGSVDGSSLRRLIAAPTDGTQSVLGPIAWSPDSKSIAFLRYDREGVRLLTMFPDGSDLKEVATAPFRFPSDLYIGGSIDWSPDSIHILFGFGSENASRRGNMYVVNVDGSDLRRVGDTTYGSWSPDGSRIAVLGPDGWGPGLRLSTMAPDGSDVQRVARIRNDGRAFPANPK